MFYFKQNSTTDMDFLKNKTFLFFVVKFLLLFCLFYYGTIFMIGLCAPGGYYSEFAANYLDYISFIKITLMKGAAFVASWFGYETIENPGFLVRVVGARGVIIAYDCVGYGVLSFWAAYTLANHVNWKRTLVWLLGGFILLWIINVLRIGLFLVAINKGWPMPLGLDHHTWFNIFAYGAIFLMIYWFEKKNKVNAPSNG